MQYTLFTLTRSDENLNFKTPALWFISLLEAYQGEAELHLRQPSLFYMICHLPDDPLSKGALHALTNLPQPCNTCQKLKLLRRWPTETTHIQIITYNKPNDDHSGTPNHQLSLCVWYHYRLSQYFTFHWDQLNCKAESLNVRCARCIKTTSFSPNSVHTYHFLEK